MTTNTAEETKAGENTFSSQLQTHKFIDVTDWLYESMQPGDACRFSTGWLVKCPECESLIVLNNEFKVFTAADRDYYRITPSLVCPVNGCTFHKMAIIGREETVVESEDEDEEKAKDNTEQMVTTEQPVAEA